MIILEILRNHLQDSRVVFIIFINHLSFNSY
jgi:hypothetical protein